MSKVEQINKGMIEAATEVGKELEKELKKIKDDQQTKADPNYFTEKVLGQEKGDFDLDDANELLKLLNADHCEVNTPLGSWKYEQTFTYESKFPIWVKAYGLVGSLLIILGTALTTTVLRRGITQKSSPTKEVHLL